MCHDAPTIAADEGFRGSGQLIFTKDNHAKDWFNDSHAAAQAGRRSVGSGAWTLTATAIEFIMRCLALMVMARLIDPAAFGMYGLSLIPVGILMIFRKLGFPPAIVQSPELSHAAVSHVFWINVGWHTLIAAVALMAIPVCVLFLGDSRTVWLSVICIAGVYLVGLSEIHAALLRRQMCFSTIAWSQIISVTAGTLAGVSLAWYGLNAWALVWQFFVIQVGMMCVRCVGCSWRPTARISAAKHSLTDQRITRNLIRFGRATLLDRILQELTQLVPTVFLGKLSTAHFLGAYQNAARWARLPVDVQISLGLVSASTLSRLRADQSQQVHARVLWLLIMSLVLPVLLMIFLEVDMFVQVLLGDQWMDAVLPLRLLVIAALAESFIQMARNFMLVTGDAHRLAPWAMLRALLIGIGVAIGCRWHASGVASGYAIGNCIVAVPMTHVLLGSVSWFRLRDFVAAVGRPLAACGCTALVWILISRFALTDQTNMLTATRAVLIAAMIGSYGIAWLCLPGGMRACRLIRETPGGPIALSSSRQNRTSAAL